jgi:putative membrane protein
MIHYDPHNWHSHLLDIRGSMLREIFARVMLCVLFSAVVTVIHKWLWPFDVSLAAHTIVGLALGLLLVFRTNSSYDRFWEGRKMWGGIVNETRNLTRGAAVFVKDDPVRVGAVVDWTVAFAYASMYSLRDGRGLGPVAARLPQSEIIHVLEAKHVPLAVAVRISDELRAARDGGVISDYVMMTLDQNVQLLVDYLGACERIRRTPLPFAYMVHLRRALIMYCYTLPFALVSSYGWLTIVATLFVTYTFFGVEEIGVEIEDPFGSDSNDLPLEDFCHTIERNLQEWIPPQLATESV